MNPKKTLLFCRCQSKTSRTDPKLRRIEVKSKTNELNQSITSQRRKKRNCLYQNFTGSTKRNQVSQKSHGNKKYCSKLTGSQQKLNDYCKALQFQSDKNHCYRGCVKNSEKLRSSYLLRNECLITDGFVPRNIIYTPIFY